MTIECINCGTAASTPADLNGPYRVTHEGDVVYAHAWLCDVSADELDLYGYQLIPLAR